MSECLLQLENVIHGKPVLTCINVQLDNLNEAFTFKPNDFDLVHSRLVGGGINASRWASYLRDIERWVMS